MADGVQGAPAYLEISGPDPKLAKAKASPFYKASDGITTISASAVVLDGSCIQTQAQSPQRKISPGPQLMAICPAAPIWTFLRPGTKQNLGAATHECLVTSTTIRIVLDPQAADQSNGTTCRTPDIVSRKVHSGCGLGYQGRLQGFVRMPDVVDCTSKMMAHGSVGAKPNWALGWSLPPSLGAYPQAWEHMACEVQGHIAVVALLQEGHRQGPPESKPCLSRRRWRVGQREPRLGEPVCIIGSPFGCVSRVHFRDSVVTGFVSNFVHADGQDAIQATVPFGQVERSSGTLIAAEPMSHDLQQPLQNGLQDQMDSFGTRTSKRTLAADTEDCQSCPRRHPSREPFGESCRTALIVLDSRVLPGMEGAPIFRVDGSWLGILALPLHIENRPTQLEIPLAVPASKIMGALVHAQMLSETAPPLPNGTNSSTSSDLAKSVLHNTGMLSMGGKWTEAIDGILKNVALVIVNGSSWASGVVLNTSGIVLTCRHLFQNKARQWLASDSQGSCKVRLAGNGGGTWFSASVVRIFQGCLDIAILRVTKPPGDRPLLCPGLARSSPLSGSPVAAIGYPTFDPSSGMGPSVSIGNAMKVVHEGTNANGEPMPALLVTTAAVRPGCSGGPLIDATGRVVGLAASNAVHRSGVSLPSCSFAISASAFLRVWEWAEAGGTDPHELLALDVEHDGVSRLFELKDSVGRSKEPETAAISPKLDDIISKIHNPGTALSGEQSRSRL
eukprot:evm.model.scf_4201.1 EVM.evm.TU.scf_4201.1   scf_4201:1687-7649(-)